MRRLWMVILPWVLLGFGCATAERQDYSVFFQHQPKSILVAPVVNNSQELFAGGLMATTIASALGERGYYVYPIILTEALLRDLGLPHPELAHQLPPAKYYEHFGADAVLFMTVEDCSSKYFGIKNIQTVTVRYELRDTRTGTLLWLRVETQSSDSGGSGLIEAMVSAAIDKLMTEASGPGAYKRLAAQANFFAVLGLPAGKYHPNAGKDRDKFYVKADAN